MKRVWGAALAAGIWCGTAGAAFALVQDPMDVLTPTQEQALTAELAQLGPTRFDVIVVQRASNGPVALARQTFQTRRLSPTDGVIAVSVADRQVGVHLGQAFADAGVDGRTIQARIARDFAPLAQQGDLTGAIAALAVGLSAESAGPSGANRAPGLRRESETRGFPWWLLALPIGAGAWYFLRKQGGTRRASRDLSGVLADLRTRHTRMLNGALRLDEASTQGKFYQGTTARTYQTLGTRSAALLAAASDFGNRLDQAEADLKAGRAEAAAAALQKLQQEAGPIDAEVAAAVTAMEAIGDDTEEAKVTLADARRRLSGLIAQGREPDIKPMLEERLQQGDQLLTDQDPTGALSAAEEVHGYLDKLEGRVPRLPAPVWADLPAHAEGLARRLQEVQAVYANERARAESFGLPGDPTIEGRIADADRALTTTPVDLEAAQTALNEAQDALSRYHTEVETAAERASRRQASPVGFGGMLPPVMPSVGWGAGPIIVMNDYDRQGGGFGDLSAGGSWGGGLSGGGGWDSGGGGDGSSGGGGW